MRTKASARQYDPNNQRKLRTWDEWYADAREYACIHGDLLVPRSNKSGRYSPGNWIWQRRKKNWGQSKDGFPRQHSVVHGNNKWEVKTWAVEGN